MPRPTPARSGARSPTRLATSRHGAGLVGGQGVELAGVAIDNRHVNAGAQGAVEDRREPLGRDLAVLVVGRDEDAGDAAEGAIEVVGHFRSS